MSGRRAPRREESFFGLHFDLHPGEKDTELGAELTGDMVDRLLEEVKPDYVQYDCKGHPGYTGYPTRIGSASPGIVRDSLAIWRKSTLEHGVALYVHYSGVWDSVAIKKNPEWARLDSEGKVDPNATSVFGPYVDELMIPQLKEAINLYDLDGVWVDGDCWAAQPDYREEALDAFERKTGTKAPTGEGDPGWSDFLEFHREAFRDYVRRYCDALHEHKPEFQITSNWMFTTLAPEPVSLPLDFLSGDYSPSGSVDTARFEARYLASTEMPWDLMAWGFNKGEDCAHSLKTSEQLKQEAAIVLSQGGGFQVYYQPTRAGWVDDWMIRKMADLARFCRARRAFSHRTETVPQVALLLSRRSLYERGDRLFGPWGKRTWACQGMLHALLELHYSVDVMAEHKLMEHLDEYPYIVLPEPEVLGEELVKALVSRTREGASLLVVGAETARPFQRWLGAEFKGDPVERSLLVQGGDALAWCGGIWQAVDAPHERELGKAFETTDRRGGGLCAASWNGLGNGSIAAVYGPFGSVYRRSHNAIARRFLRDLLQRIFPSPMVEVWALPSVDLSLRRRGSDLLMHLVNTGNKQAAPDYTTTDFASPSGPVALELPIDREPDEVHLDPGHMPVEADPTGGKLKVFIESLPIHGAVVVPGFFG